MKKAIIAATLAAAIAPPAAARNAELENIIMAVVVQEHCGLTIATKASEYFSERLEAISEYTSNAEFEQTIQIMKIGFTDSAMSRGLSATCDMTRDLLEGQFGRIYE